LNRASIDNVLLILRKGRHVGNLAQSALLPERQHSASKPILQLTTPDGQMPASENDGALAPLFGRDSRAAPLPHLF
jgi:hypothetical protein